MPVPDLSSLTVRELLDTTAAVTAELRSRGYIRTGTSLSGELMEHVVGLAYAGTLEKPVNRGWDAVASDGRRIQVKTRNLEPGITRPFTFKNTDFDVAVLVLTDITKHEIVWAREVALPELQPLLTPHGNDYRLTMQRAKRAGVDITEHLSATFGLLR
jgi:hypothetical protein